MHRRIWGNKRRLWQKIQKLAREASARHNGLTISPLLNTDKKGGAYRIMLQQFKRAIAVTTVNGHGSHILSRLHYVRDTLREAFETCHTNHSNNRWTPDQQNRASWFCKHTSDGYAMFEQFRNGHYFHMPLRLWNTTICVIETMTKWKNY